MVTGGSLRATRAARWRASMAAISASPGSRTLNTIWAEATAAAAFGAMVAPAAT